MKKLWPVKVTVGKLSETVSDTESRQEKLSQRYYRSSKRYYRSGGTTVPSAAENPPLRPCAALPAVLPPAQAVLPR